MPVYHNAPGSRHWGSVGATPTIQFTAIRIGERDPVAGIDLSALAGVLGMAGEEDNLPAAEKALMESLLLIALEKCVELTGYEPSPVPYRFKYDEPPRQFPGRAGVWPLWSEVAPWIELPRRPLQDADQITGITWREDPVDNFQVDASSNPPRVRVPVSYARGDGLSALVIEATVGPATPDPRFVFACLALAAYLYEHRGCGIKDAVRNSGAREMLRGLRVARGGL